MGTLLSGVAGVCMFAGILFSAHSSLDRIASGHGRLNATANPISDTEIQDIEVELRVIETRALVDGKGVVVFNRAGIRDSVIVDLKVLDMVGPGDLLSEHEGTIER